MKKGLKFSKTLLLLFLVISFQKSFAQANEPTNLVATVGVNSVSVAFTTPTTVVGGAITNYEYSLDNGSNWVAMSPAQTNSPLAITGLTNCTDYSIKIRAVNISGVGTASSAVTVTPQNGQQTGVKWTFRNLQVNNNWIAATYGNGLFVSVGLNPGTVMTSPDGITWTSRTLTNSNRWLSVTYGNGLFVAVGDNGNSTGSPTDFVMTSPDGITWTSRTPPLSSNGGWNSVTYGNGLFIAVGYGKVMKSLDGINWTNSTAPANNWVNCTYGNGLFVAVANMGSGDFVMTSSDGITWTSRTAAANIYWSSVIYGNGLFVAVANYGTGNRVMTSPDGINWTLRASADNSQDWKSVTYGNGQFVAVSYSTNDLNQVMTSPDGINWTIQTVTRNYQWQSITYGNNLFLAVSSSGTMTSTDAFAPDTPTINTIIPSGFSASVSFTAPTSSGFSAITNYEYSLDNGSTWVTPSPAVTSSPLRIGGLSSGITYPIQLRALNTVGASCASATVNTTTLVPIVPNEPTNAVATAGLNAVSIEFTVPTNDGGADITNYEYTINDGLSWTALTSITSPLNISGLTGCTNYTIKIRAVNSVGGGAASSPVVVTPQNGNYSNITYWKTKTSAADYNWRTVTYGNGLFVAVAQSGTGNRVMTSPDGITWTSRTSAADNNWSSVTYGNGLFVAVALTGTGNRVMTSSDGITWTSRTSAADNNWSSVTYGNGLFVAVALTGTGNRVMTSSDGITWTSRTSAADNFWSSVTYGNGLFVAVAYSGTSNRVMTSPDGITWTIRTSAADNNWSSVTYGNGLFVAVATSGAGNRVMTSENGIDWTIRTSAANNFWVCVTYGNDFFVAVATSGTGNRVMTSPNGITWTIRTSAANNIWFGVTYGNGLFVAVATTGTGNRVMTTSEAFAPSVPTINTIATSATQADVSFTAPTDSGFSAISNYEYSIDNGSTWVSPSPAVTTSPLTITGLTSGTNYPIQLRALNSAGASCASVMLSTTTLSPVTPPTASAQTFCAGKTVADLVATGTDLKWYDVETGGTALVSTTVLATGTYYVSQTLSCESARTSVEVTVNTTAVPTASAQTFCGSKTVADLVATGTSLKWYSVATNGTALVSSTALATGTYYVSQTLNGCESSRTSVAVTVNTTTAPTAAAQTFCTSGTVTNLVASGTDLQWYNVATNGTALTTSTALATGTYYVSQTLDSCESARTLVAVTVNTSNIWTGTTSTAWNDATNWSCGVPLPGNNIEIPSGLTNYPILGVPIVIGNIINAAGATLSLGGNTLTVSGTFSGLGTLIGSSTSGLTINGTGNQGIFYMNETLGNNKLANFTLNSTVSGSVTLGNAMDISGILTLTNGTFNTGGNLTLKSNGIGTAVVAPILNCVNVAITGDVTVERFFPGKRAFRLISSPVTTTSTIKANWQEGVNNPPPAYTTNLNPKLGYGTHITGSIIGDNGFDATQTTSNSMFTFSNTAPRGWAAVPNTNVLKLTAGVPYRLMIRGSRAIDMSTNDPTADNTTLRAKGALKICDASAGVLSETSGVLSFVGNPYQAIVDIKDVLTNSTNLNSNSYQVWDPKASTRGAYIIYDLADGINATFGSAVNQYLQPWQACFVATNSAGSASITFNELNKVTNSQVIAGVYRTNNLASYIRLTLYESNTLASNGAAADGLIVKFGENYANAIDGFDALKLSNIDETFSTKNNTSLVGIESRLSPVASDIIPLNIAQYRFTNYTMVANGTNMSGLPAYLHDQLLQTYTEIPQSGSVNYSYVLDTTNPATSASDRFRIVFENPTLSIESNATLTFTMYPNPSKQGVFDVVMNDATEDTKLVIYNTIGQEVYATNLTQATINHINPNKVFANGVYYVKIKKDAVTTIKKLIIR